MTLVEARCNWSSHLRQSSPSRKNFIEEFSAFSCCLGAYLYNLTQYNVERDGVQSSKMEREQGREQELAEWGRYMEYISHLGNVGDDGTVGLIRNSMVVEWVDPGVGADTRGRACIDYNLPRRSRLQHGILRYGVSTWITKAKPWIDKIPLSCHLLFIYAFYHVYKKMGSSPRLAKHITCTTQARS